jgi:hypothetical protein
MKWELEYFCSRGMRINSGQMQKQTKGSTIDGQFWLCVQEYQGGCSGVRSDHHSNISVADQTEKAALSVPAKSIE